MVNFGITSVIDLMDLLNRLHVARKIEEMKIYLSIMCVLGICINIKMKADQILMDIRQAFEANVGGTANFNATERFFDSLGHSSNV